MKILKGNEKQIAEKYMEETALVAKNSRCNDAKCGSIVVKDNKIIGKGFNSPPSEIEEQRRCRTTKDSYHKKVTDKTCCVHAEQRAIIDAIKNSDEIKDSILYFIRVDEKGEKLFSRKPYCTICSKMALDNGIKEFVLYHQDGIISYDTKEYNTLSYNYKE